LRSRVSRYGGAYVKSPRLRARKYHHVKNTSSHILNDRRPFIKFLYYSKRSRRIFRFSSPTFRRPFARHSYGLVFPTASPHLYSALENIFLESHRPRVVFFLFTCQKLLFFQRRFYVLKVKGNSPGLKSKIYAVRFFT